jgi:hypothetical protein
MKRIHHHTYRTALALACSCLQFGSNDVGFKADRLYCALTPILLPPKGNPLRNWSSYGPLYTHRRDRSDPQDMSHFYRRFRLIEIEKSQCARQLRVIRPKESRRGHAENKNGESELAICFV